MPLKEVDANTLAGRESRVSSNVTTSNHARKNSQQNQADVMSSGVMSMLRTTTDFGDLDDVISKPKRARPGRRPSVNGPPLSRTSSHYSQFSRAESVRSRTSNHSAREPSIPGAWPTPGLQPPSFDTRSLATTASDRPDRGHRSYSLTGSTHHPSRLMGKNNRSATSLQSAGPSINRPRSPYQHSARFYRPDLRPASPAWSDGNAAMYIRPNFSRPMALPRTATSGYPFPPQGPERRMQRPPLPMHPSLEGLRQNGTPYSRTGAPFRSAPSPLRNDQTHRRFNRQAQAAPYPGFVQRVKNLLEERATSDTFERPVPVELLMQATSDTYQNHEVSHFETVLPETAAELPATSPQDRRLTRDLVRAALGTSSDAEPLSSPNLLDSTMLMPDEPEVDSSSLPAADSDVETAASSTDSVHEHTKHTGRENDVEVVEAQDQEHFGNGEHAELKKHLESKDDDPISDDMSEPVSSVSDLTTSPSELPANPQNTTVHSFSDDPERVKHMERPFSLPQAMEEKPQPPSKVRQSMPAQVSHSTVPSMVNESSTYEQTSEITQSTDVSDSGRQQSFDVTRASVDLPHRLATAMDSRGSWAVSIASRVMSEPESTIVSDDTHMSWARSIASRAVSVADERTRVGSRPASAGDLPVTWARSSIAAMRNSALPTLPESKHSSVDLNDNNARTSTMSTQATVPAFRRSGIRESVETSTPSTEENSTKAPPTDVRYSALKQFQSGLPDLTEDSQEDASTTNLRMLGSKPPTFRASRQRNEIRSSHRSSAVPSQSQPPQIAPASYLSRNISATKGIPSLNFSSTDLTKAMNRVLGIRSSRSLESLQKRPRPRGIVMNSPKGAAANPNRYTSYFLDNSSVEDHTPDPEETERSLQQQEQLINEIEKISIPSINALSVRLSELFPTIKKSTSEPDMRASTEALESAIEEIRELGTVKSMEGTASKHDSVIPAASLSDETHADTQASGTTKTSSKSRLLDKELPPLPVDIIDPRPSIASGAAHSICADGAHDEDTVELEAISRRASTMNKLKGSLSVKKSKSLSVLPSSPDARPWNKAESFPWTLQTPAVKLKEPGADEDGDDEASPSNPKLKSKKSHAVFTHEDGVKVARTMSPGPRLDASLIPRAERRSADGRTEQPMRKGLIGSISRKIGKRPRTDTTGFPLNPEFLHPAERLSSTSPGDRYPTTSLTPPVGLGLNIDETARSFFSDDSSEHEEPRIGIIRKRLTRLKNKKSHSRALSTDDSPGSHAINSPIQDDSMFSGSHPNISEPDVVLMMYDEPAIGMSKTEFRAKRLVEKIRKVWFKSGKLLRGKSQRTQNDSHHWHEVNSLYEGA